MDNVLFALPNLLIYLHGRLPGQVYIFINQVVSLESPLNSLEGSDRIHTLKIVSVIFLARYFVIAVTSMHGQSHWTTFYELICERGAIWGSVAKQSLYNLSVAKDPL